MLDAVSNGLIVIVNGFVAIAAHAVSLPVALSALCVVSLSWLAACEIEDLDQMGFKPEVGGF